MPWVPARFKDKDIWAEVDDAGRPKVAGGRQAIRYSDKPGATVYRAGASGVQLSGAAPVALADGISADEAKAAKKPSSRASGFGSAGRRTQAQADAARAHAHDLVSTFVPEAAVCFTDGACSGNPGPCGSGTVVKLPGGQVLERYMALGIATNNVGELTAIDVALDLLDEAGFSKSQPIEILTDSKYSYGVLSLGWKAKANAGLISGIKRRLQQRNHRLHWVAGHVGIAENERADQLANMGVDDSKRGR